MAIDLNSSLSQQAMTAREKVSTQKSNGSAAPVTHTSAKAIQKDTVELSDTVKVMQAADAKIANTPDVDSERVASIKAAIDSGSYKIDAQQVAEKMIDFDAMME
ncbi:flagellar biosynthesis anti-sigma factor FlgM [Neptunomonas japonica]|uniref:Negative regulator of flagellin synthesis n=1 Tax=Neptunomonas japonica JAMM 1380 TaxID=1441457 RepID=A0A7R6P7C7_9GAMM|nr:flagellar biosynthesis anti-sigma factor FlgM [Neptunomonas japonica]BBB28638.1 negative regulator of flagellin synthesis FlgM [Neptunomonas japonica JAMM 1380]